METNSENNFIQKVNVAFFIIVSDRRDHTYLKVFTILQFRLNEFPLNNTFRINDMHTPPWGTFFKNLRNTYDVGMKLCPSEPNLVANILKSK